MVKYSPENFTISGGELESKFKVVRIFFVFDFITIVYSDDTVKMLPKRCLKYYEEGEVVKEALKQLRMYLKRQEVERHEEELRTIMEMTDLAYSWN